LQESRAEGILAGSYDGLLYLQFIPMDVSVEPGDSIVTSGAGGVYPKGIPVGEVSTVSAMPSDVYQTIVVRPITRVTDYEEVLVLIGNESEIVPNKEAAAAAQAATAAEAETDATKEEEAETEGGQ
jgi:rod shape-determining protein MreC